jgi:hypothetical protein
MLNNFKISSFFKTLQKGFFIPLGISLLIVVLAAYLSTLLGILNIEIFLPLNLLFLVSVCFFTYSLLIIHKNAEEGRRRNLDLFSKYFCLIPSSVLGIDWFLSAVGVGASLPFLVTNILSTIAMIFGFLYLMSKRTELHNLMAKDAAPPNKYLVGCLVIVCFLIGFSLRIYDLNYIQGSDLFNLSAAMGLFNNGHFFYTRNLELTYLIAGMFKVMGPSLFAARLPLALMGAASVVLIYFLGRFVNSYVGILSSFLLAISPLFIEESTLIREYSEDLMIAIVVYILLFKLIRSKLGSVLIVTLLAGIASWIYVYSQISHNFTSELMIIALIFSSLSCLIFQAARDKKRISYIAVSVCIGFILFLAFSVQDILIGLGFQYFGFEPYWFQSFFLPTVQYPMQWFSQLPVPETFILAIFLVPLFLVKDEVLSVSYATFFGVIATFVFKYANVLNYVPVRYTDNIYPLYILILATSIYTCFRIFSNSNVLRVGLLILFAVIFINPKNIAHAVAHDLVIAAPYNDRSQPTSTGARIDVRQFIDVLSEKGVISSSTPIVLTSFDPSWLLGSSDIEIDPAKSFSDNGNYRYDIGKNVYLENSYWRVYELANVIQKNSTGIYITKAYQEFTRTPQYNLAHFKLILSFNGYEVYRWYSSAESIQTDSSD